HPTEKLHQRAFTGAVLADNSDHGAGSKFEAHVFEHPAGCTRISETNMFQADALRQSIWHGRVRVQRERRHVILQPGETARAVQPDAAQETDLAHRRADVSREA